MKSIAEYLHNDRNILLRIHEKVSSFTAHLLGPIVFNIGIKEESWNLTTEGLIKFPDHTVGKTLGEFLKLHRLEPIAGAESHDLYHVLFGFSPSFKDEVALQFFLKGNGKTSIASFGTSLGAWILFPGQWSYFKTAYARGKKCGDISKLNLKAVLEENVDQLRSSLLNDTNAITNSKTN